MGTRTPAHDLLNCLHSAGVGIKEQVTSDEFLAALGDNPSALAIRAAHAQHVELLGRGAELVAINSRIRAAQGGSGGFVIVEGEAGIGKTRLLTAALADATQAGHEIFSAGGHELEGRLPFGIVTDALSIRKGVGGPRERIARLLETKPSQERAAALLESRYLEMQVTDQLLALLEELCEQSLVVLALDDVQWADPSTLVFLRRLSRQASTLRLAVLLSCRPLPRSPELAALLVSLANEGADHLPLGPLGSEPVRQLVAALIGAKPGPRLQEEASGAGGNPFFVSELIAALLQSGAVLRTGDVADVAVAARPPSLPLTILHRLSYLTEETLELLRIGSILGTTFSLLELAAVRGREPLELLSSLRDAFQGGILEASDTQLAFRHDLIREALYADLPAPIRIGLHRDAAAKLKTANVAAIRLAEHLIRGAAPGDIEAVALLRQAADEIGLRSPAAAADIRAKSLELAVGYYPDRGRALLELAIDLLWSGKHGRAEQICREALDLTLDPTTEGAVTTCLIQVMILQGHPAKAVQELEARMTSASLPEADQVRLKTLGAFARMLIGDLVGSARLADHAVSGADLRRDDLAQSVATAILAAVGYLEGRLTEGAALAERAISIADGIDERLAAFLRLNHAILLVTEDRFDAAEASLRRGRVRSEELGAIANLPYYHWGSLYLLYRIGRWDEAVVEYEAGLAALADLGLPANVLHSHALRALIALHRGDLDLADRLITRGNEVLSSAGPQQGMDWMMLARALSLEAHGELEAAGLLVGSAWDFCVAAGLRIELPILGPELTRLAVTTGDMSRALAVTTELEELAMANPSSRSFGTTAMHCRALVEGDAGRLTSACDEYRAGQRILEGALVGEQAGALLASAGSRVDAVALLKQVVAIYESLGASRDVSRVEATLRNAGVKRGRRGRRGRPNFGWDALTATELEVARLVADGLSNRRAAERMFLSRYTVQTHVSHILSKLELSSRVELAAAAARRL